MHEAAATGFAREAASYARGRPEYPAALHSWLREVLNLAAGRTVIDLGAGTGKFSQLLLATGAAVVAVEPVPEMLAELQLTAPGVTRRSGTAEAIPAETESVHAVVCAQSFHWFANPAALAEIHRVLRPGGHLGLIWNVRDPCVDWVAAMTAIITPYEGDAPRHHTGDWQQLFPASGFGPLQEQHFANAHCGPPERVVVERMLSTSFIAALPETEHRLVASRLRELIATHPALRGQRQLTVPYTTVAYSCPRE